MTDQRTAIVTGAARGIGAAIANRLAHDGCAVDVIVTMNAIAPGVIATDMLRATAERMGVPFEDFVTGATKEIPVGRVGTPDDVAAAASFFCSEGAGFVSGQVLYVAGGPQA